MARQKSRIADVAAAAHVSIATVDRVLNERGGVRAEVQARVLGVARRLQIDRQLKELPPRWLHIGVLMQPPSVHFYEDLQASFDQLAEPLQAQRVRCSVHHYQLPDPASIAAQIEHIASTCDALIVVAYEHPLVRAALTCAAKRIAVITMASDLGNIGRLAYVGPENRAAGRTAAELMGRFLGPSGGSVLLINGARPFLCHQERTNGFMSALRASFPRVEIAAIRDSAEDPAATEQVMRQALREFPDLRGVYNVSAGDEGVARALATRDNAERLTYIAHDLTDTNRRLLSEGVIDVVLDQDTRGQVIAAVQSAMAHAGRAVHTAHTTPAVTIVMRENLMQRPFLPGLHAFDGKPSKSAF